MRFIVYLLENNAQRFKEETEADMWPIPKPGDPWPSEDGEEGRYEIVAVGEPRIGLHERTYISQDIVVQRIDSSN